MNPLKGRSRAGFFVFGALTLVAVACGGGAGDGPTAPAGTNVAEVEFESFQLANAARRDGNVEPQLGLEELVARIAREHSESMRDNGFFGHSGPNGGLQARLRAAGVRFSAAGENLAKLSSVPSPAAQAHRLFMDSAEHRQVMLDSRFQVAGVGVARSGNTFWLTQVYVSP